MLRHAIQDLIAFLTVAREKSFTRASAQLGVSPSALSHSLRRLEEQLGIRLLSRTTRNVSATDAGERLIKSIGPRLEEIESELIGLSELRDKPTGTIRITAIEHATDTIIRPALEKLLPKYPDIHVEVIVDYGLTDIVEKRLDAGVRLGEQIAKDMIAVPIGPDVSMAVVGSPSYFENVQRPKNPRDLTSHNCINLLLPTFGGLYAWEFERSGREIKVHVEGQLVFNNPTLIVSAALGGLGLAYVPDVMVHHHIREKRLVRVLSEWCPKFPGYHLYYPNRRQPSPAFSLFVDTLRYRHNRSRQ